MQWIMAGQSCDIDSTNITAGYNWEGITACNIIPCIIMFDYICHAPLHPRHVATASSCKVHSILKRLIASLIVFLHFKIYYYFYVAVYRLGGCTL